VRRSFIVLSSLLVAGCVLAGAGSASAGSVISPEKAVAELNAWRAKVGVAPVTLDAQRTADCRAHAKYHRRNPGSSGHVEDPSKPGYSKAGSRGAASSVLAYGLGVGRLGAREWEGAVYHRTSLLDPRLTATGFWAEYGIACMAVFDQEGPGTQSVTSYPYPVNGQTRVETTFGCNEVPNPCDGSGAAEVGFIPSLQFDAPWRRIDGPQGVQGSITPDGGTPVPVGLAPRPENLNGGLALVPRTPLAPNAWYTVRASGTLTGTAVRELNGPEFFGTESYDTSEPFSRTWRFRTAAGPPLLEVPSLLNGRLVTTYSSRLPSALTWVRPDGSTVTQAAGARTHTWRLKPTAYGRYQACITRGGVRECVAFVYRAAQHVSFSVTARSVTIRSADAKGTVRRARLFVHRYVAGGTKVTTLRVPLSGTVRRALPPGTWMVVLAAPQQGPWRELRETRFTHR